MGEEAENSALLSLLNVTATVTTILMFLTGVTPCREFFRKGSTGEMSSLPFVAGALNCAVWAKYGVAIAQPALIFVNFVGAALQSGYSVVFYRFAAGSASRHAAVRQIVFAIGFFATMCLLLPYVSSEDPDKGTEVLGYVASLLTVAFSASPLSGLGHVMRTGSVASLPLGLIVMTFLVTGQWWLFGNLIGDGFISFPNMLGCCICSAQLAIYAYFRNFSEGRHGGMKGRNSDAGSQQLLLEDA